MSWFRSQKKSGKGQASSYEDDLICPISLALPIDPVTAEDGRVYDRDFIEAYYKGQSGTVADTVKSRWTGEMVGRKLLRADQHRAIIERTIANGVISDYLAKEWQDKMEENAAKDAAKDELLETATEGDLASIETLATNYFYGQKGFMKDNEQAFVWSKLAHKAGSVQGTTLMGVLLLNGRGVREYVTQGYMYLGLAAGKGSVHAASILGKSLAKGMRSGSDYTIDRDIPEGRRLLTFSLERQQELEPETQKLNQEYLDNLPSNIK